jgi:colicin import membrane protein
MARKLKTYQTSLGFYDLAIAAPSMKAALNAWDSRSNLFHQGFAKETTDLAIVTATMDKPGVVLRRPVGSNGAYREHTEPPTDLLSGKGSKAPVRCKRNVPETPGPKIDDKAPRDAVFVSERERNRHEAERRVAQAAREREVRTAKLEATVRKLDEAHRRSIADIESERAALDKRSQLERESWEKQKARLEARLRRMSE